MARDPMFRHTDDELRDGLWRVAAGADLRLGDPLRAELLHLGLVRPDALTEAIHVTSKGRELLDSWRGAATASP